MEDYWFGICVGWVMGFGVTWWLYRDLVANLRKQISGLEEYIKKFT